MIQALLGGRREEVGCTVEVVNTFESLEAHVRFDGGVTVEPGDEVLVHGAPVEVPYGHRASVRRVATIKRAGWLEKTWVRMTGDLEFMELCEFSFSERASL
ncbi:hypothetical protein [Aurantimonas sp. HBX-1]|uniref:hypothetical protein n=1 Tax=Aurantimonas sp. HBX-1 TaxID=2906072 RepID=UPI001F3F3ABE|nr:hypothetical protein [Aurantimonas sp. HBX-1]UIJ73257.1 hypothetical protein LXB15_06325 [Aurantimonas sp. HBX-1]